MKKAACSRSSSSELASPMRIRRRARRATRRQRFRHVFSANFPGRAMRTELGAIRPLETTAAAADDGVLVKSDLHRRLLAAAVARTLQNAGSPCFGTAPARVLKLRCIHALTSPSAKTQGDARGRRSAVPKHHDRAAATTRRRKPRSGAYQSAPLPKRRASHARPAGAGDGSPRPHLARQPGPSPTPDRR